MKKELVISAKFDTSDFDKSVETMQKKLKDLYAPSDMIRAQTMQNNMATGARLQNNGFGADPASMEAFKKATQSARRELDQLIQSQVKTQNGLGKELSNSLATLDKLRSTQKNLNEGSNEELKVKKQIAEVEKTTWMMREQYKNRDQAINQLLDAKERNGPQGIAKIMDSYKSDGINGALKTGAGMLGPVGMIGAAGAGLGFAGGALNQFASMYRQYGRMPVDTNIANGSAIANTTGRDLGNVYSGRSAFEGMWGDERARAAGKSLNAMNTSMSADKMGLFGNMMKWGGAGMASGATAGAIIGSPFGGPLGSAVGAGVLGAAGGLAGGITGMMRADPNSRDLALSQLPFVGERFAESRRARIAQTAASDYASSVDAEKNMNPLKKMAQDDFEKNMMRNLGAQRSMGLSNDQFNRDGGYLNNITSAGFTHQMGIDSSNGIMNAGGSARMAQNSAYSLQMQRMGVTNADSVLGKLSGSIQSPEANKRATVAIMSEAMKAGLDNSDFSEENRRFIGVAADIISKTGASGEKDQERISSMLAQFMGARTNAGVSAAQNAYETTQTRDSQLDGRRGTLRMVASMQDPILSKLGQQDTSELLGIRPDMMNENNPEIASFARKAGVSPAQLIKSMQSVNQQGRYELPGQGKEVAAAAAKVNADIQASGMSASEYKDASMNGKLSSEQMANLGDLETAKRRTDTRGFNPTDALAQASEDITSTGKPGNPKDVISSLLTSQTRREDKFVAGAGTDNDVVRKNFNEMSGSIDQAADSASKATTAFRQMAIEMAAILEKADKTKSNAPIEEYLKKQSQQGAQTQPQSGKGKQ